jgi:hypothetical protein
MTTALRPLLLIFALLCFAAPSAARVGDATNELTSASASTMTQHSLSLERMYGVKERRTTTTKTIHWTLNGLKDKYALTFSQDSPAKVLQLFWLQLHDTNGTPLSKSPSLHTVTSALERFLTLESIVPKYCTAVIVKDLMQVYLGEPDPNSKSDKLTKSAYKSVAAGVAGAVLTNPLDVIRNEMFKTHLKLGATVRHLYQELGMSFLWRGMGKNTIAVAIPVACTIFLTDMFIEMSIASAKL